MPRTVLLLTTLASWLINFNPASAQTPQRTLSIADAISRATDQSKALKINAAEQGVAGAKLQQARNNYVPAVSVNLSYVRISNNIRPFSINLPGADNVVLNPQILDQSYNNVQVRQLIWGGGKLRYGIQAAEREAEARQQVTTVSNQAGVAGEGIRLAQLAVKQARANLETARLQHSYTVITAPANGIVSNKSVQVGQVVQPGQTPMQIAGDHKVWVVANFKETQVGQMRVGQAAEVKVDAYPGKVFRARVESLSPATGARFSMLPPDNATGNFVKVTQRIPIRIALVESDPATPLRAGMSVAVTVN